MAETQIWSEESFAGGAVDFCLGLLTRFSRSVPVLDGSLDTLPEAGVDGARVRPSLAAAAGPLSERVEGVRAIAVVGPDGRIGERVVLDPEVRPELLAEFATLVRIADRSSADAGLSDLAETTWSSRLGTVLSRRVEGGRFLLLVGGPTLRTSLARYALRLAARRMAQP